VSESEGESFPKFPNSAWTKNGVVNYAAHDAIFPHAFRFNIH
jgi:hypothetical protein